MRASRPVALVLLALIGAGCARRQPPHKLWYELRAPVAAAALHRDPLPSTDVVSELSIDRGKLTRREEFDFVIFSRSTLIFDGYGRWAIVVTFEDGRPAQVFRLRLPKNPEPADWTPWRPPDYVEANVGESDATWTFMHDLPSPGRSTKLPSDQFQLRYRITEWDGAKFFPY